MKKYKVVIAGLMICPLLIFQYYKDNQWIVIKQHDIQLPELSSGESVTILQVTDLHEKKFGKEQQHLIEKINESEYDMIIFTGDLMAERTNEDFGMIFSLIERIDNRDLAYFVQGNTDPPVYQLNDQNEVEKSDFVKGLEERNVKLLEGPEKIQTGNTSLTLVNYDLASAALDGTFQYVARRTLTELERSIKYENYQNDLLAAFQEPLKSSETIVGVTHYPVVDNQIDYLLSVGHQNVELIDLIIAGHYHGGQIRIPFMGAFFVPEGWYDNQLLPPQNRVKGLWEYEGIQQYVSTGLGSSNAIPFLNFRLFNPPEINLITLKSAESQNN
ncbi:metallophosphoesterase [Jeotgalibacillus salarius]|uniref:Calcineurin-like phosphoesterase domain-containing protein n=1 Tax=Jeotgalibacillus salarius TaxID=546023 RepID=A0A4Y8LH91_9BACL|nr:metallophosphoesterase [Jeotgalibacillus salarius]TFE01713.1 hypothetical protein E2626_09090 [Jeotgalibacillus salarius]